MQKIIEDAIDWLITATQLEGYALLAVTAPLTIIQGIVTVFPFATLLLLHTTTFGLVEGLLISWLLGWVATLICFVLARGVIRAWIYRRFGERLARYDTWQRQMNRHGGWVVILMRSIPFIPGNLVSIMAALSPIHFRTYLWSTAIGIFSQIWLFALLGTTVILPTLDVRKGWVAYIGFCALLGLVFAFRLLRLQGREEGRSISGS